MNKLLIALALTLSTSCAIAATPKELKCLNQAETLELVAQVRDNGAPLSKSLAIAKSTDPTLIPLVNWVYKSTSSTPREILVMTFKSCVNTKDPKVM